MIELSNPANIAALRARWQAEQQLERTKRTYEYTESRNMELQRIQDDYKASEEKRQAKIAARNKELEKAENERWERIWKEKHEDKSYYAR